MTVYAEYTSPDGRWHATVHDDGKTFLYDGFSWEYRSTPEQETGLNLMKSVWLCHNCGPFGGYYDRVKLCQEHKAQLDSIKWDPRYLLELKDGEIGHS